MGYVLYAVILVVIYLLYSKKEAILGALGMKGEAGGGSGASAGGDVDKEALDAVTRGYGPAVAQVAQLAVATGQIQPLLDLMKQSRTLAWDVRYGLMEAGAVLPTTIWQNRVYIEPQSTEPLLLLAARVASEGLKARGSGVGSSVTAEGANSLHTKLAQAEQILLRAASMDPEDPTPYARMVSFATYQDEDEQTARNRLAEALRRAPDHFGAIKNMTHYISPYWCGSKEKALAFGREMASGAAEGSLRAGTIITSHVTMWHQLHWFEDGANKDTIRRMLADPAVQAEIRGAYQRSVASPRHQLSQWSYFLLNQAAGIFYCIQDQAATAEALTRIGSRNMNSPWEYMGNPAKVFAQARKWAGL